MLLLLLLLFSPALCSPKCLPLPEDLLLEVVPVALDDRGHLVQLGLARLRLATHLRVQLGDVRLARLLVVIQTLSHVQQPGVVPPAVGHYQNLLQQHGYIPGASYPTSVPGQLQLSAAPLVHGQYQPQTSVKLGSVPALPHNNGYLPVTPAPAPMLGQYPVPGLQSLQPGQGLVYNNGEVSTLSRQPIMSTVSQPSQYLNTGQHMMQSVPVMVQYQPLQSAQYQPLQQQQQTAPAQIPAPPSLTSSYHESVAGQSVQETDQVDQKTVSDHNNSVSAHH